MNRRLSPLDTDKLDPSQKAAFDAIASGPRGTGLPGPFDPWLRSPGLAVAALGLGDHCRFNSHLSPALRELAIIVTGKHWQAQLEFWAHSRMALEAGVSASAIEAIRVGETPTLEGDQQVVYELVSEYLGSHRVSDSVYERTLAALGEQSLVDLVGLMGYYCLVCATLNVFRVPVPAEAINPFPEP